MYIRNGVRKTKGDRDGLYYEKKNQWHMCFKNKEKSTRKY